MRSHITRLVASAVVSTFALTTLPTRDAHACGGFFCSQAAPVNQAAEQIIFSKNVDGTVTAVVNILYQGTAERFAWVLPISGVPDVKVSSNIAFQRLLAATTPQYSLTRRVEGTCDPTTNAGAGGAPSQVFPAAASAGSMGSGPGNVTVAAQGSVGPYDFVAISVAGDAGANVAIEWLGENGYDVSALGEDVLNSYLEAGLNLLAFRLTKGNEVGAIRPISVTYPGEYPAIPIRPTAVAANDDMGVMVYVVAEAQAIPKNYKSLVLNEALINWFSFASTYNDVINRAADEAGGQGFVTELGAPSINYNQTIYSQFDEQNWNLVATGIYANGQEALNVAASSYASWDGFREAVAAAVTLPADVTLDAWLATPWLYADDARITIDTQALIEALKTNVIDPVVETQKLLISRPYLTRLFTTLSADEMTLDPLFSTNADLADISNVHSAEQVIECGPGRDLFSAPWRVDLGQGGVVRGTGSSWPFDLNAEDPMPANRKVVQLSEKGSGEVVKDNTEAIWKVLKVTNVAINPVANPDDADDNDSDNGKTPIGGIDAMKPVSGPNLESGPLAPQAANKDGCSLVFGGASAPSSNALSGLFALALGLVVRRLRPRPLR